MKRKKLFFAIFLAVAPVYATNSAAEVLQTAMRLIDASEAQIPAIRQSWQKPELTWGEFMYVNKETFIDPVTGGNRVCYGLSTSNFENTELALGGGGGRVAFPSRITTPDALRAYVAEQIQGYPFERMQRELNPEWVFVGGGRLEAAINPYTSGSFGVDFNAAVHVDVDAGVHPDVVKNVVDFLQGQKGSKSFIYLDYFRGIESVIPTCLAALKEGGRLIIQASNVDMSRQQIEWMENLSDKSQAERVRARMKDDIEQKRRIVESFSRQTKIQYSFNLMNPVQIRENSKPWSHFVISRP